MNEHSSKARSRIEALLDVQSFVELGALVRSRSTDFVREEGKAETDGVICGYGSISGKPVYIYAEDREILSGSIGEMHGRKIARLYDMAMKMGAPVVELLDSSGIRLEEATDALYALSKIYKKKAKAKGLIPLYSIVFGQAGGGMAVLSALSDFRFLEKEEGRLFINAPDAVKGNKDDSFARGEAQEEAGNVDFFGTEEEIFREVQKAFRFLPANNEDAAFSEEVEDNLNRAVDGFESLEARESLTVLSDQGEVFEMARGYGEEAVTAFLHLNGQTVGGIATNGGALHWKDVEKMNRFLRFCNSYSLPVLLLCDVSGFENCLCNEKHMAKAMAEFLSLYGNSSVPLVTVVKKAIGSLAACLGSKGMGADLVFAYPASEISLMEEALAMQILYPEASLVEREEKGKSFLAEKASAESAAARGYIDAIILPEETRQRLISAFDMLFGKADFDFHKKYGSI